ncbi:3-hydroxyacyl-CoA dehydrogenase NAD-binding domain-containing protein [Kribbella kalugense]|uniref:3-hydroxyacyl-CoA dehydrogenase n=1 Tax=Kribbella kalugense TaxID=2512221 RepID=A0A4R8A128_9ACTN|nr:3-hydroxyacyl-CoA dehydrogenase NAD-binding domain-containing protein [Kribbella kalugense]TDW24199.1 3-hydroxyacyl-CoA dehydrogenase [Kribbella kalugense]
MSAPTGSTPRRVGVVGAGTMGSGIARVAADAGHPVCIYDSVPGAAAGAVTHPDIRAVTRLAHLHDCEIVIEAVVEDLQVKRDLFAELSTVVAPSCVLATNTSALSPTAIAAGLPGPERFVGMHFFNPPERMQLVEVVAAAQTAPEVVGTVRELAVAWGKKPVTASATPGFIVNRIARPFYGEALRLLEEQVADAATVDAILTEAGGFRLGPFALMDLIGHDVNQAVTRSVWMAFGYDPRYAPSSLQQELVDAGRLGRKTGRGVFRYEDRRPLVPPPVTEPPREPPAFLSARPPELETLLDRCSVPIEPAEGDRVELPSGAVLVRTDGTPAGVLAARLTQPVIVLDRAFDDQTTTRIAIARSDDCSETQLAEAVGLLQSGGLAVSLVEDTPGLVVARTVAMLVNQAADALLQAVASSPDIDLAMVLGTGYPLGPLAWGERYGAGLVLAVLDNLWSWYHDPRYRATPLLRRWALSGELL